MNAKEAYELAASKADVSVYLDMIKNAAGKGHTSILVDMMNDFQVAALTKLGYYVYSDHGPDVWAIAGRQKPTHHKISWHNGGIKEGEAASVLATHLTQTSVPVK